jgi:hypothetical protein
MVIAICIKKYNKIMAVGVLGHESGYVWKSLHLSGLWKDTAGAVLTNAYEMLAPRLDCGGRDGLRESHRECGDE